MGSIILIDAYSQIFRLYYALPMLNNSRGEPVNAIMGIMRLLLTLDKTMPSAYGAVAFDKGRPPQRMELCPEYKANRPQMPPELRSQIPAIERAFELFGWNVLIQEGLEAFQDIRANDAEEKYLNDLYPRIDLVEKRAVQAELGVAYFVLSGQMILRLGIATVALTGAYLLSAGSLDVVTFFMFLLVASRLYDPMSGSLINLGATVSLGVQCERMDEILCHEEQRGMEALSNKGYDVEFKDVRFAYDTSENVLNGVTFTARQGEVTALIGPSGSGKTTVSRLASRFWDISSGTISVGGMDISKIDPETLMSLYSIVFQDVTLFNNTVLENIRIGRKNATDEEVIAAAKLAHVDVFAENLPNGWNSLIGENGSELSGGERQRISIARAFLKDAPIILLDEATASLDVENETFIQESLSRLIKEKTVIIIAHRMRTVAGADKIVVLRDGKVYECGTPSELTASEGFYKKMCDLQQGALRWNL